MFDASRAYARYLGALLETKKFSNFLDSLVLELPSGNSVPAQILWVRRDPKRAGWQSAGLQLHVLDTDARDRLIEKLFTEGRALSNATNLKGWTIFWSMLSQIFARDAEDVVARPKVATADDSLMPAWLQNLMIDDVALQVGPETPEPQDENRDAWPRAS